jgi:pilus assembly protein Flp/PilA
LSRPFFLVQRAEARKEMRRKVIPGKGMSARRLLKTGRCQEGQALVEYAIILLLVAVVVVAIVGSIGSTVSSMFSVVVSEF